MIFNALFQSNPRLDDPASWRALFLFAGYRLFLAVLLLTVYILDLPPQFLGSQDAALYTSSSLIYVGLAILFLLLTARKWGPIETQIKLQLVIDIIALTLIMHASGGLHTGLGSLMLVVVVAGGALVPGRLALFIAAVATLAILFEVSYSQVVGEGTSSYSQTGILGATFFITAWLAQWVAIKMESTEILAEERAKDVANMAVLNQHIISRMQIGVMALDKNGYITMLNQSAREMLGVARPVSGTHIKEVMPILSEQIWSWRHHHPDAFIPFQANAELPEVKVSATKLDSGEILVFIENTTAMAQQVQQLKLASLGRLTASIAHEIRNPLGAISHAGELLAEKSDSDASVLKLTDIIQRHSQRVNGIIETILQMSRRKEVQPKVVVLATWLEKFIHEFSEIKKASESDIALRVESPLAKVAIDPEQLHQVLWNLMENALHFSRSEQQDRIVIRVYQQDKETRVDVMDNGPGVTGEAKKHLFEPFHSDRQGGTGLGLYLARELCQANGARLSYLGDELNQSCFRISFPLDWQEYKTQ